jgi:predicted tellurium resistance membrane protein TerC
MAIALRIILLFVLVSAIDHFQDPYWTFTGEWAAGQVNMHATIVLIGGIFIIYTAIKELTHMLTIQDLQHEGDDAPPRSVQSAVMWIVIMNLVFSFDSILSAIALTDVFMVMAAAIVVSGVMMVVLADRVSVFLERNRLYEVLGLFILLLVGIMLVSEGGHLAHLNFFGQPVESMSKTTFYFTLTIMVLVEVAQSRYQKKLLHEAAHQESEG